MALKDWLNPKGRSLVPASSSVLPVDLGYPSSQDEDRVEAAMEAALKKGLNYQDYQAFDGMNESGGYFGKEFDIRATAGRVKALYGSEPWVYATATLIAKTISAIQFKAYKPGTEEEVPNHPLIKMINTGSMWQSGRQQQWCGWLDLVLGGNFFLTIDPFYLSMTMAPVELVTINLGDVSNPGPSSITVSDPSRLGSKYTVPYERVIHIRLPNPSNPFYGLSAFSAAARPLILDRYKAEFEMAFYLRGATANGVIECTTDISTTRFARLMRSFENSFTGKRNWWRTLFLPKGATWKANSSSMKDMEFIASKKEDRLAILSVLGIPPSMVGLTEDVNYSTSEGQMQIFQDNTILPIIGFIEDGYNSSHLVKTIYRGQVEIRADMSKVKNMRDQGELAVKGEIATKISSFFTINEIRKKVFNEAPRSDGDVYAGKPVAPSPLSLQLSAKDQAKDGEYRIHAVTFGKEVYKAPQDVTAYAVTHGWIGDPVIDAGTCWRVVQQSENDFVPNSFKSLPMPDSVTIIMGKLIGPDGSQAQPEEGVTGPVGVPPESVPDKQAAWALVKETAANDILTIERSFGQAYLKVYKRYLENVFMLFERAVASKQDPRGYLDAFKDDLKDAYITDAKDLLERVAARGYSMARAKVKSVTAMTKDSSGGTYRFTDRDAQAIDVLEARGKKDRDGKVRAGAIERFYGFNETRTNQIMSIVEAGFNDGKTLDEIAAFIRQTYGENYPDQAFTISRTETLSALSAGIKDHQEDLKEVFTKVEKSWVSLEDGHVRDSHLEYESLREVDVDYEYAPGLSVPRDYGGDAGEVINCFVGSTKIQAVGAERVFRRHYVGPLVVVQLHGQFEVAATPNHPVLTPEGWVTFGSLTKGQKVFKSSGFNGPSLVESNMENVEANFDEIFSSISKGFVHMRVAGSSADFHGDGTTQDVDVVFTDRGLANRASAAEEQVGDDVGLPDSNLGQGLEFGLSGKDQAPGWIRPTHSLVGPGDLLAPAINTPPGPLKDLGLTATTLLETGKIEVPNQRDAGHSSHLSQLHHGQLLLGVELIEVGDVERRDFDGHVYNLQTEGGWYLANGLIAHNCRCSLINSVPSSATSNASAILDSEQP